MKLTYWASVPTASGLYLKEYTCKQCIFINVHSLVLSMKCLVKEEQLSGSQSAAEGVIMWLGQVSPVLPTGPVQVHVLAKGAVEGLLRFLKSKHFHIPIC